MKNITIFAEYRKKRYILCSDCSSFSRADWFVEHEKRARPRADYHMTDNPDAWFFDGGNYCDFCRDYRKHRRYSK